MCGRTSLSAPPDDLRELFGLDDIPEMPARYNIAPTQPMPIVRMRDGARHLDLVRWGLVPSFARDVKIGSRFINARIETVKTNNAFRQAAEKRRCLVAVDGFYEWKKDGKAKRPFWIHAPDKKPFALAGLWEVWHSRDGEVVESCTIITQPAKGAITELHDRMPLLVAVSEFDAWLDPSQSAASALSHIVKVKTLEDAGLVLERVSMRVNSPANDDPSCIGPPEEDPQQRVF